MKNVKLFEEFLKEDAMVSGGPAGMGTVASAQPSSFPGATIGIDWTSGGGTEGSGDISVPYNPSGSNRMFQKIPVMGKNHGARTGKKSREKKLDVKELRDMMKVKKDKSSTPSKVMSFDDFLKNDITTIKK